MINRRTTVLAGLSAIFSRNPRQSGEIAEAAQSNRPNIILIVTDDQDSASVNYMPNVKRLMSEGTTLNNCFATTPICTPSRTSMILGQYTHNHGVRYNVAPGGGVQEFLKRNLGRDTVFSWLSKAGYQVGVYGKFLNGYSADIDLTWKPAGVSDWGVVLAGHHRDFTLNRNGKKVAYKGVKNALTTVLSRLAGTRMAASKRAKKPFFLYIAPQEAHTPYVPERRYRGKFASARAPRGASFGEEDVSDKPRWVQGWGAMTPERADRIDGGYRQRLEALASVDAMLGSIMNLLRKNGADKNTYIIFTTDNGWLAGAHRLEGKASAYTPAIQLPTVIWGPRVRRGVTEDRLALNIDLAPTIADWAGAKPGPRVEGRSLAQLLNTGVSPDWRRSVLIEFFRFPGDNVDDEGEATNRAISGGGDLPPTYQAIRSASASFVRYATGEGEYYDLVADPDQLVNRYDSLSPNEVQSLTEQLNRFSTCKQASCISAGAEPLS